MGVWAIMSGARSSLRCRKASQRRESYMYLFTGIWARGVVYRSMAGDVGGSFWATFGGGAAQEVAVTGLVRSHMSYSQYHGS